MNDKSVQILPGAAWGLTLGRGGSKGLPGKNVRLLGGQPLIAWAVAAGRATPSIERVICSTDDEAIAAAARAAGAEVPFQRPAELANDTATDLDVFAHALGWFSEHETVLPEFFVQLRPTTPFRDPAWIETALDRMRADPSITCMRTVAPTPVTPYKMWRRSADGKLSPALDLPGVSEPYNMPRQALPPVFWHTGQLDVIRTETLLAGSMTGANIHALDVAIETAVDIDGPVDFVVAEQLFEQMMHPALRAVLGD
ncbi:MAG: acylneuraminate cytidylyltransferase family protein [Maritimibacter sp.]